MVLVDRRVIVWALVACDGLMGLRKRWIGGAES